MEDGTVILTGGEQSLTLVTLYKESFNHVSLPELNNGRSNHGCSFYIDSQDNKVWLYITKLLSRCRIELEPNKKISSFNVQLKYLFIKGLQ